MATIPPKTWSWRGHSSGQNILFFQVIKIKLVQFEKRKENKNFQFANFGKFPILGPDLAMENDIV
jgi:hypothetical protein